MKLTITSNNNKTIKKKINKINQSWFLKTSNKTNETLARLTKKEKEKVETTNIRNE
jgi:hypothetical protein